MSESLLEDMILSLDSNFDNYLDYKELAEGLKMWRRERRENKRKALSRETSDISLKSSTCTSNVTIVYLHFLSSNYTCKLKFNDYKISVHELFNLLSSSSYFE